MKPYLCLTLLAAFECGACGPANIEGLRKDVEASFLSKSFLGIATKYCDSQGVRVTLENEIRRESHCHPGIQERF